MENNQKVSVTKDKRIRIIVGHYGSGKTEFSVNYAVKLADIKKETQNEEMQVAIADLDVINPYFRSREKEEMLDKHGIISHSSVLRNSALDLPAISADLSVPILDENYQYVMDVGGDELGARVLGSMHQVIEKYSYDMFMVINANREYTVEVNDVIKYIREIEGASKLSVTGLVSNTHLLWDTSTEDILKGCELVKKVSEQTGIPVKYVVYPSQLDISSIENQIEYNLFSIDMIMREDWM
ncbi:MAG: ATP-binding protein [Peptostreptococcaceae bacterium]|nr:ATP-binding protein [Peptostreptococcaceae bacterium]